MKKIAFIGFGRRGKTIFGALLKRSEVEIVGVFDPDPSSSLAQSIRLFTSVEKLLQEKPDIAIISTPPNEHFESIQLCNRFGINVLCEKPLVIKADELAKLEKFKIKIYVAYQMMSDTSIRKALDLVQKQKIHSIEASQRVSLAPSGWKLDKEMAGGGTLLDNSSHLINLAIAQFGMPRQALAFLDHFIKEEIEQWSDVILFYPDFNFKVHSDWMSAVSKDNRLTIFAEKYDICYREKNDFSTLFTLSSQPAGSWMTRVRTSYYLPRGLERDTKKDPLNKISGDSALDVMLAEVIEDLDNNDSVFYRRQLSVAKMTNEIIERLYRSKGRIINL